MSNDDSSFSFADIRGSGKRKREEMTNYGEHTPGSGSPPTKSLQNRAVSNSPESETPSTESLHNGADSDLPEHTVASTSSSRDPNSSSAAVDDWSSTHWFERPISEFLKAFKLDPDDDKPIVLSQRNPPSSSSSSIEESVDWDDDNANALQPTTRLVFGLPIKYPFSVYRGEEHYAVHGCILRGPFKIPGDDDESIKEYVRRFRSRKRHDPYFFDDDDYHNNAMLFQDPPENAIHLVAVYSDLRMQLFILSAHTEIRRDHKKNYGRIVLTARQLKECEVYIKYMSKVLKIFKKYGPGSFPQGSIITHLNEETDDDEILPPVDWDYHTLYRRSEQLFENYTELVVSVTVPQEPGFDDFPFSLTDRRRRYGDIMKLEKLFDTEVMDVDPERYNLDYFPHEISMLDTDYQAAYSRYHLDRDMYTSVQVKAALIVAKKRILRNSERHWQSSIRSINSMNSTEIERIHDADLEEARTMQQNNPTASNPYIPMFKRAMSPSTLSYYEMLEQREEQLLKSSEYNLEDMYRPAESPEHWSATRSAAFGTVEHSRRQYRLYVDRQLRRWRETKKVLRDRAKLISVEHCLDDPIFQDVRVTDDPSIHDDYKSTMRDHKDKIETLSNQMEDLRILFLARLRQLRLDYAPKFLRHLQSDETQRIAFDDPLENSMGAFTNAGINDLRMALTNPSEYHVQLGLYDLLRDLCFGGGKVTAVMGGSIFCDIAFAIAATLQYRAEIEYFVPFKCKEYFLNPSGALDNNRGTMFYKDFREALNMRYGLLLHSDLYDPTGEMVLCLINDYIAERKSKTPYWLTPPPPRPDE